MNGLDDTHKWSYYVYNVIGGDDMKRTNIILDEELVKKAKDTTGLRTTRAVVDHALRELLRHRRQRAILKLRGQVDWAGDLAAMRRGRGFS